MARSSTPILLLVTLLIASSQAFELISRLPDLVGYEFKGPLGYVFNSPDARPGLVRLYAVTNSRTLEVIYTTNQKERQALLNDASEWEDDETPAPVFNGSWVYGDAGPAKDRVPLYRLKEKSTKEHLWTVNAAEAKDLKTKGWESEGITGYFPKPVPQPAGATLVYRYNYVPEPVVSKPANGTATATTVRPFELISRLPDLVGYEFKGPLGYVFNSPDARPGLVRKQALLNDASEWEDDETPAPVFNGSWVYGDAGPAKDRVPLYRLKEKSTKEHLWTVDAAEAEDLKTKGWESEGITGYFPKPVPQPAGATLVYRYKYVPAPVVSKPANGITTANTAGPKAIRARFLPRD
ncbi:hypothetical protein MMC07_008477 [Pseudocyphellaria aurata]|nr:hypothetical protein [Pseudocyphellaria aurata]